MITRERYLKLKQYLKLLSKKSLKELCDELELSEDEITLLMSTYDGDTVTKMTMDNYISHTTYTKHFKRILSKIDNYYKQHDIHYF